MNKYLIFEFIAVSLFVSLGLNFTAAAGKNETVTLALTATPKPKILARIERIEFDKKEVIIACPPIPRPFEGRPCYDIFYNLVNVKTFVNNPKNVPLTYEYKVSGGRIIGEGANVTWNLNVRPGNYTITVSIKGNRGVGDETRTQQITVRECDHCPIICICPELEITGSKAVRASESVVFAANVKGGTATHITYNWTVSQGEIVKGQGTSQIKVKTTPEMTGTLQAIVEIGGDVCEQCFKIMTSKTIEIIK